MVVQQSRQTFKMGCDGDFPDCFPLWVLYSDPLICVLKNQTLKDETLQKGGRLRPSPFQPTKHSFAIQPLLPFQMQMDEVQQLFTENHLRHFPLRKKSFISFPGPGSRDKPEIKKHGVLLISATTGSRKQKTPFSLHFISDDLSPPHSSQHKERAFLLPGSLRNHRRTFTLSLHELM